jgi:putative peptidoglycan lipid II flippase
MGAGAESGGDRQSVIKSAGAMGAATFMSRILGLVREQVFAYLFGAGNATDAFQVAFRIPNLLRDLFAEGAMSAALVPVFTQVRELEGERRAWRVAGLVFRVLFVAVAILALLGMLFSAELVSLYAGKFREIPGKFELTVSMTRVLFPFFPMIALAAAFMGVLNACGRFFIPAFSSALFNLISVVFGAALAITLPRFTEIEPIVGMAIGVLAGGMVQALSQVPSLRAVGYRWQPRQESEPAWNRDPALRKMLLLMGPGFVGLAATQINVLINTVLATSAAPGAVSWLNYAFRLMQFPIGIFGVSMAAATLPAVARLWVRKDAQGVADQLERSLRQVFALNLPASAGLAFLGVPIIAVLFEYGRFTATDTLATAWALAAYALGLCAYSAVKVLVPACYAMGNTRSAVISSLISILTTLLLNVWTVKVLGYPGLALGTSIAAMLNAVYLIWRLSNLLAAEGGKLQTGRIFFAFLQHTLVAVAMGATCWATWSWGWSPLQSLWVEAWGASGIIVVGIRALGVALLIAEGLVVLLLLARLFGIVETVEANRYLLGAFKRKLGIKS